MSRQPSLFALTLLGTGLLASVAQAQYRGLDFNNRGFGLFGPYVTRPYAVNPYNSSALPTYNGLYNSAYAYPRYGVTPSEVYPSGAGVYDFRSPNPLPDSRLYLQQLYTQQVLRQAQQGSTVTGAAGTPGYQAYYPAGVNTSTAGSAVPGGTADGSAARLLVRVPSPSAEVWFQGVKTQQQGEVRDFISPPLAAGKQYRYNIRLAWDEGGQNREMTRSVLVRAGDNLEVDLTAPEVPPNDGAGPVVPTPAAGELNP